MYICYSKLVFTVKYRIFLQAWHSWAFMNFEALLNMKNNEKPQHSTISDESKVSSEIFKLLSYLVNTIIFSKRYYAPYYLIFDYVLLRLVLPCKIML